MLPDWHANIRVPTAGDDIVGPKGCGMLIVDSGGLQLDPIEIRVQPATPGGAMSPQGEAVAELFASARNRTRDLLDHYLKSPVSPRATKGIRVELKNLLENHRSLLEYTAQYLVDYCQPKPAGRKIMFPVAGPADNASTFSGKLNKWFPGLQARLPEVFQGLLDIQPFSGDSWLKQLADLTNHNKHQSLSQAESRKFSSIVIRHGDAAIRLGDLGIRSMRLDGGVIVRFVNARKETAELTGPVYIDRSITRFPVESARLELVREERDLLGISGYDHSIAHMLWAINVNVLRTVDGICARLR